MSNNRPLVTFALFAYNQEQFIKEAVEAALAQTYSPLEIYISDDCSPDRTFEIIQELTKDYEGPHEVIINRNEKNLGLADHVNHVFGATEGALIVMGAGDDISVDTRTEKLVDYWIQLGKPSGVCSLHDCIDANGEKIIQDYHIISKKGLALNEYMRNSDPIGALMDTSFQLLGAVAAWSRELWVNFGEIPKNVINEDVVFSHRSIFSNGSYFIDEVLVKYRMHQTNSWSRANLYDLSSNLDVERMIETSKINYKHRMNAHQCVIADLNKAKIPKEKYDSILFILSKELYCMTLAYQWWTLPTIDRLAYHPYHFRPLYKFFPLYLLPIRNYISLICFLATVKKAIKKALRLNH